MTGRVPYPVVHLELHTPDLPAAAAFYSELCGWRQETVQAKSDSYLTLDLRHGLGGGIVDCPTNRSIWLPYVEVPRIECATERARGCGARVLLEPREGPGGWRSVVATPASGELAFWQPKH